MKNSTSKQQEQQIQKEQREQQPQQNNKSNKNSKRNKSNYNGKGGTQPTQPKLSLCSLGGRRCAPNPPSSCSYFVVACFRFCNFLVSLRWCQDHGVNELVKKLRFHNASILTKMGSRNAKWKVEVQK